MGYSDSIALQAGMADEATQIKAEQHQSEVNRNADKFLHAFMKRSLTDNTGFTTKIEHQGEGVYKQVPSTVYDMFCDSLECGQSFDQGLAQLISLAQLGMRKGDIDAVRTVAVFAQAWGTQQVEAA